MKKLLFTSLLFSGIFLSTITIAECRQGYTYAMGVQSIGQAGSSEADFVDPASFDVENEYTASAIRYWGEACVRSSAKNDILIDWGVQSSSAEGQVYDANGALRAKRYDETGRSVTTGIGISWRW